MKSQLWVMGLVTTAAWGAPFQGRVLLDGAPAANVEVRVLARPSLGVAGCETKGTGRAFGGCLCPDRETEFGALLRKGLPAVKAAPAATTTTAADGTFTLEVSEPNATLVATSADGALVAEGNTGGSAELELRRAEPVTVRLTGVTKGAVAYLSSSGGDLEQLQPRDGLFVSKQPGNGSRMLLVTAEGAQTALHMLRNGKPMMWPLSQAADEVTSIELVSPLPIRGVVTENGKPVAGVEVIADAEHCPSTTRTNAKGEFEFSRSNARPYSTPVMARTKGKVASLNANAGSTIELALRESVKVELTLVDEKGAPVGEQWVRLKGPSGEVFRTDVAGKLTAELPAGELKIFVDAPWLVRDPAPFMGKGTVKKKVVIHRGAVIKGRVVDPHGGKTGAQSVEARLVGNDDIRGRKHGRTNDHGFFTIEGLTPGKYVVSMFSDKESAREVTAPGEVELKAEVAHFITGRVSDPSGKPFRGVFLSAQARDQPGHTWGESTDAKGEFVLRVGGPGTYTLTGARGKEKIEVVTEVAVSAGAPLKLTLARSPSVTGKLTDASGKPVAGERVEAIIDGMHHLRTPAGTDPSRMVVMAKASHMYHSALTGPDGAFDLPVGSAVIVFAGRGSRSSDPVTATPGKPVTLVMKQRTMATGRVVDASGRPVGRYHLNGTEVLDADGRFEVPLFKVGPVDLTVQTDTSPDETRTVDAAEGATSVAVPEIKLRRSYGVGGFAVDALTGQPAKAHIDPSQGATTHGRAMIQPDGSFHLNKLSEGPVLLKFSSDGYAPAEVTAAAGQLDLKVKLMPKASLEVTVRKPDEAGSGVQVVLTDAKGLVRAARSDTDGRAIFPAVDPGSYTVHTVDFQNQGPTKKVVLRAGKKATLAITTR